MISSCYRTALGAAIVAVLWTSSPALACKQDVPRPFSVAHVAEPSFATTARITALVRRGHSFPPFGCWLSSSVELHVAGLPAGTWGLAIQQRGSVPAPKGPVEIRPGGKSLIAAWSDDLGPWRHGIDDVFEVSLVDASGRRSYPLAVRVHSSGHPQFFGWVLIAAAIAGLAVWRAERRRRIHRRTAAR